jgi:hypothetical protein
MAPKGGQRSFAAKHRGDGVAPDSRPSRPTSGAENFDPTPAQCEASEFIHRTIINRKDMVARRMGLLSNCELGHTSQPIPRSIIR